jgi:hypothetical protein
MGPMFDDDDVPPPPQRSTAGGTAWVLVFLVGLLLGCGSLYWLVRGRFFDENLYDAIAGIPWTSLSASVPAAERVASAAIRIGGVLGLCASLLVMAVGLTAYRTGERWAWYVIWALPFCCTLEIATLAGYRALTPTAALWDISLLAMALFALIAPYRWFFARSSSPSSSSRALT